MRTEALAALCVGLCTVAVGCSDSVAAPVDNDVGTFSATVSGAEAADLSGLASSRTANGVAGHSLQLVTTAGQSMNIATPVGDRPAPGTYPIIVFEDLDPDAVSVQYGVLAQFAPNAFSSVSGTLTISSSSAGEVSGSFNFTARNVQALESTISVSGSFVATHTTF